METPRSSSPSALRPCSTRSSTPSSTATAPVVAGVQNDPDEIETEALDRDPDRLELAPDIVAFSAQPDPWPACRTA
ncbi:hypothetical protein [Streptomyces abikoensis]|uniref:hypothetical protein n=1 Tax=Streptomyces abikoensis TaxID=97398 RepID=UPI0019C9F156|nr:hypothetical protein GCM10010214_10280 [Streptomyces abikoensis]